MEEGGYNQGNYNVYQQSSDNIGEVEQVVMLYDGAINFIRQAKEAIVEENFEKRYNLINRAIAIITGLNSCLNFTDETQETATALDEFYQMIDMRLLNIQCDDSLDSCDKVIDDLKVMREAWADVVRQTSESKANGRESEHSVALSQEDAVLDDGVDDLVSISDPAEEKPVEPAIIDGADGNERNTEIHIDA